MAFLSGFAGDDAGHAVFLWSLTGPGSTGYAGYAPRTVFPWLSAGAALVVDMVTAGFACVDAFALFPPPCRQAQDPRHLVTMDKKDSFSGRARRRQWQFMCTGWFCW